MKLAIMVFLEKNQENNSEVYNVVNGGVIFQQDIMTPFYEASIWLNNLSRQ
jgi:hypothetical protein